MSNRSRREELRQAQLEQAAKARKRRILLIGLVVLTIVVGVSGGVYWWQNRPQGNGFSTIPPNATANRNGMIAAPGRATAGAPTVEVFADYQCPNCAMLETYFGRTLQTMAENGEIILVYRTMNFLDDALGNSSSTTAAIGATCADSAGLYAEYHARVFENQPEHEGDGFSTQTLRVTIPTQIGLTDSRLTSFQQCFDTRATEAFVDAMNTAALADGVTATPTIRVNGKTLRLADLSPLQPETIRTAIRQLQ